MTKHSCVEWVFGRTRGEAALSPYLPTHKNAGPSCRVERSGIETSTDKPLYIRIIHILLKKQNRPRFIGEKNENDKKITNNSDSPASLVFNLICVNVC
jgi:hypothetical protein